MIQVEYLFTLVLLGKSLIDIILFFTDDQVILKAYFPLRSLNLNICDYTALRWVTICE